ncbi:hypothetical protein AAVH_19033 [Aphelenchoides avenae]|nr:hypothetical protein AAVH_19033 [Aphelenchus avenae]
MGLAAFLILMQLLLLSGSHALTCFQTDANGEIHEASDDSWVLCGMTPTHVNGDELIEGRAFGVSPDADNVDPYQQMFAQSDDMYQVLSICVYEKYNFDAISPKNKGAMAPELLFRCMCNFDRCNRETTFSAYLAEFKNEQ